MYVYDTYEPGKVYGHDDFAGDEAIAEVCRALNHPNTLHAVTAERAFLKALGGGCQSAVAAWARVVGHKLELRAGIFSGPEPRTLELSRIPREAAQLGQEAAARLSTG